MDPAAESDAEPYQVSIIAPSPTRNTTLQRRSPESDAGFRRQMLSEEHAFQPIAPLLRCCNSLPSSIGEVDAFLENRNRRSLFSLLEEGSVLPPPHFFLRKNNPGPSSDLGQEGERAFQPISPILRRCNSFPLSSTGNNIPAAFAENLRGTSGLPLPTHRELSSESGRQMHVLETKLREMRRTLLMEVGLVLPADLSTIHQDASVNVDFTEEICQQICASRFVSESVGRGAARAECEGEMQVQLDAKNLEIARLSDRLHYCETMNREMSRRNQQTIDGILPADLIEQISRFMDFPFVLRRFRRVCTAWRNSSLAPSKFDSLRVPNLPVGPLAHSYLLRESTLYSVSNSSHASHLKDDSWFLQLREEVSEKGDTSCRMYQNLSTKYQDHNFKSLDVMECKVLGLSKFLFLEPHPIDRVQTLVKKAVILPRSTTTIIAALHTEINPGSNGLLSIWKNGDSTWTTIGKDIADVVVVNTECFAVGCDGELYLVDDNHKLKSLISSLPEGEGKLGKRGRALVVNDHHLYMVSKDYTKVNSSHYTGAIEHQPFHDTGAIEHDPSFYEKKGVSIELNCRVYLYNKNPSRWDVVNSVGDHTAFLLGPSDSTSVDVRIFPGFRGNSLYVTGFDVAKKFECRMYGFRSARYAVGQQIQKTIRVGRDFQFSKMPFPSWLEGLAGDDEAPEDQ